MGSFIKVMDEGIRNFVFNKYSTIMGLSSVTDDTAILPKEMALRMISENRGRTYTEFISIWRPQTERDIDRARTPIARHGLLMEYTDEEITDVVTVKAVPVGLRYDIYFWSKNLETIQQVLEEYLFGMYESPNLSLNFNNAYPLEMYLHYQDIVDESTINQMTDVGLYFVKRASIYLEGWVGKVTESKTIKEIHLSIYDNTADEDGILLFSDTLTCEES